MKKTKRRDEEAENEKEEEKTQPEEAKGNLRKPGMIAFYLMCLGMCFVVGWLSGSTLKVGAILGVLYLVVVTMIEMILAHDRREERLRQKPSTRLQYEALAANAKATTPTAKDDPRHNDGPIEGPPEETFEEMYNKQLEFPLSGVASVLLHVVIAAVLIFVIAVLLKKEDKSAVEVKTMSIGGLDDFGAGSSGSGGMEEPLVEKLNVDPATAAEQSLADPTKLPQIEETQQTIKLLDPTGKMPVTSANAAAYASLDKSVRDKLLGAQRGAGNEKGKGTDGSKGTGPGGTGNDSTFGRGMRWNLRFKIRSGRDYLEQLRELGAKIIVPIPGTEKFQLIEDLNNPKQQKTVGIDFGGYGNLLRFTDARRDVVREIAGTLELDFKPPMFIAVFSKEFEDELAAKEKAYRNRRAEDIEETAFRITVAGGTRNIIVDEQKLRK